MVLRPITDIFLSADVFNSTSEIDKLSGDPKTIKTTPLLVRVEPHELELTYMYNPVVFNGVNKIVQTAMSFPKKIVAKDPKVQEYFNNFVANLGSSGSDITWEELLSDILKHQIVYGKSFVENVFNTRHNRIVDWDLIDPKKMDFAKDSSRKIVLDNYGNPIGFFEIIPWQDKTESYKQNQNISTTIKPQVFPDKRIVAPQTGQSIFLYPEEVAHIKLYTIGDGFYPIGLIEPIYKNSLRKMNMEDAVSNAIYRHGFPIIWAQLGDMNHEPTPQQIDNMLQKLKTMQSRSEIATPYYYNLHILEGKNTDKLRDHLNYYIGQEIAGLGVPFPFVMGDSSGATQATLGKQDQMFLLTLKDLIRKTAISIEKYMFAPVCKYEKFKEVPKLEWEIISDDELDRKSKRLIKYIEAGMINPDLKISEFITKSEELSE